MIKKLRRKFILTNMLLVTLVLAVVFAAQVGNAYQRVTGQSYASLRNALSWRESAPPPRFQFDAHSDSVFSIILIENASPAEDASPARPGKEGDERALQFILLPAFLVRADGDGVLQSLIPGSNADITEELAQELTTEALASGKTSGILKSSNLRFMSETAEDGSTKLSFVSRSWELQTIWNQVRSSLLVCLAALVGFFLISLFLSGVAVKPVERSWEQQRRFVADASHELKTPLTVILTNTNILLSHPDDTISTHQKWLEDCQAEAQQMKGLVDDMLYLAKNDAAKNTIGPSDVDFSDLLLSCCLTFESVAFESQVSLENEVTPGLTLTGDGSALRRLAGILLDNACKYAGAGGAVQVTLHREKDEARFAVHNTGEAISPEHLEHLFDRFYRADTARSRQNGGYGLGLAIAKSIVETHKGRIEVASGVDGTTFTVFLPLR